ncbi:hypothetical protein [Aquimarina aggregata]|uniref:hypothetical protein n=1 Tax=Aquimarina aggregata TaxID=1642818 RepID=UPI002491AF06|nr:hypothetical protein [Aquimarina aggregata]
MATSCAPAPINKKEYISDIGKVLVKEHGKKQFYKPEEVKKAHRKSKWYDGLDFSCWAMSTYSSHSDFDRYHQETGEICDYTQMKTEMLNGLSVSPNSDWMDIPDLDIDTSWLDFGDVFDGVLDGIGDVISGILDGLS